MVVEDSDSDDEESKESESPKSVISDHDKVATPNSNPVIPTTGETPIEVCSSIL